MSEELEQTMEDLELQIRRQERIISIQRRAEEKYLINLYQTKLRLQCEAKIAPEPIQIQYDEVQRLLKKRAEDNDEVVYGYMINCNPDEKLVDIHKFMEICKKAMTKCWLQQYCWVIEQRAESFDTLGAGFHFHALIIPQDGKRPSQVGREFANSFKKATDTSNWNWFQVKSLKKQEFQRKIGYLVGLKSETEKNLKQRYDVNFRNMYGIEKAYFTPEFDFMEKWVDIPQIAGEAIAPTP